jgi:hypothetical protein
MNKKQKKAAAKKKGNIILITDLKDERHTTLTPFDSIEELQDYLIDELDGGCDYNFDNGNDVVVRGEILKVNVTETEFKVKIK